MTARGVAAKDAESDVPTVHVLGAGPAGALVSILLAKRGYRVTAYERLPDLRRTAGVSGRSINLALADRGIAALKRAGVFAAIEPLLIPMRGRMLHSLDGAQQLVPYGSAPSEVIYSVSRSALTAALLNCAERECHVDLRFLQNCISVDPNERALCIQDTKSGKLYGVPLRHTIGADGAGSVLRRFLVESGATTCREEMLDHGYKELTIASDQNGAYRLDPHALHVWPRGEFMLIALPNLDATFTATLFLPHDGERSFGSLTTEHELAAFFRRYFPDAYPLMPDLARQFFANPTGSIGTVRCERWQVDDLVLIGDAAHAIVPFHGQGMNCAFEDCVELDELLATSDWNSACAEFEARRKPNCDAIADMALENYTIMRNTVLDPKFPLRQAIEHELERRHPKRFIPRYSMVMFHHEIPYATALERGRIQHGIVDELALRAEHLAEVDFEGAARTIEARLPPMR